MDLKELAAMYRDSGEKCREHLTILEERLASQPMSNTERLKLRREICLLAGMARDTIAISNYLENYYERKTVYERKQSLESSSGISGASAVYQVNRSL